MSDRPAQLGRHGSSSSLHAAAGNNSSLATGSVHQAASPVGITQTCLLLQLPHELLQLLLEAAVLRGTQRSAMLSRKDCHAMYATCRAMRTALSTIISNHVQYVVDLHWDRQGYDRVGKLQRFPKLASLRKLFLRGTYVQEDLPNFLAAKRNLNRLATVEQLRYECMQLLQTTDVANIVAACHSLKKLMLSRRYGQQFNGVSLAALTQLRQLTDLSLKADDGAYGGVMDSKVLIPLAHGQPGLDTLLVKTYMDMTKGMPVIAVMSHLRSLTITLTEEQAASREFCTSLHALSSLTNLCLHGFDPEPKLTMWWNAPQLHLPRAAVAAIAGCTQLRRLGLHDFSVSGCADIALLASMPALRYLKAGALEAESDVDLGGSKCCWEELVLWPTVLSASPPSPSPEQLLRLPLHSLRALSFREKGLCWRLLGMASALLVDELADRIVRVAELTAPSVQTEQGLPTLKLELGWDEVPSLSCATTPVLAALMPWALKLHELTLHLWYMDEAVVHQMALSTPNLKHLVLEDCDIAAEAWSAVPALKGLQDVIVDRYRMSEDEDERPLIDLLDIPAIIKCVVAAARPVRVRVGSSCMGYATITAATVDGCTELEIGGLTVNATLVHSIVATLPQLRRLRMSTCRIEREAWAELQSLSVLEHLCICHRAPWEHPRVVPQDLVA